MDDLLRQRVNEYELAAQIYSEMKDELGTEKALALVRRALDKRQQRAARELRERLGGNSLELLAEHYRRQAEESDVLEILEITDTHIACKVTRCVSAEAFAALGCPEVCRQYCDTDFDYIKAFNPKMKLVRTKGSYLNTPHR